jgi:2-polyprenyl-3-methyl-5-hydroxy-6-metoxy-1,4-benzoquinol methylase
LNILDYGSGNDFFLNTFNQKHNLYYLDLNRGVYKKNINKLFDLKNSENFFDIVTLWGVLEHVANPYNFFKIISKVIKKNGLLVIEVPSSESILSRKLFLNKEIFYPYRFLEPYRHITFFSKLFFEIICKKFDFKIIKIVSNGLDLQTILSESNKKEIIDQQHMINNLLLGDHYRVFLKKE